MRRRSRKGFWLAALLIFTVGFFLRGRVNTATSPVASKPALRAEKQSSASDHRRPSQPAPPSKLVTKPEPPKVQPASRRDKRQLRIRVIGVHDGDTLTGLDEAKTQHKIRLDAIDAPELGQPYGQASKRALSGKVFGEDVVVTVKTKDKYGRTVGHVLVGGRDVNLEMLEEGMAWHYEKYDRNKRLAEAERDAKAARLGLWADGASAVALWDYRAEKKSRSKARAAP